MRFPAAFLLLSLLSTSGEDLNVFPDRIQASVTNYAHTYQLGTNAHTVTLAAGDVAQIARGDSISPMLFTPEGSTNAFGGYQGQFFVGPGVISFPVARYLWSAVSIRRAGSVALRVETSADLQAWSTNGFFRITATKRPEP